MKLPKNIIIFCCEPYSIFVSTKKITLASKDHCEFCMKQLTGDNLKSDRWDFNDFYGAFHRCKVTKAAIGTGVLSTEKRNLSKFLEVVSRDLHPPVEKTIIPPPFDKLLKLQKPDGKWEDKKAVLECLCLPTNLTLSEANIWENATAFAVAALRQQCDLFHLFGDAHDRGRVWISVPHHITNASELIATYHVSNVYEYDDEESEPALSTNQFDHSKLKHNNNYNNHTVKFNNSSEDANNLTKNSESKTESIQAESQLLTTNILDDFYAPIDNCTIIEKERNLDALQQKELMIQCKNKSLKTFVTCTTHHERFLCFEELTAMLGDGHPATPGLDDWRRDGVLGHRPLCIQLLCKIHQIAQERLHLEEIRPASVSGGRGHIATASATASVFLSTGRERAKDISRGRWAFIWNGVDVVKKIIY
eukprot:gene828-1610_t